MMVGSRWVAVLAAIALLSRFRRAIGKPARSPGPAPDPIPKPKPSLGPTAYGSHYEPQQILQLAAEAGFGPEDARTATMIALAESDGWTAYQRHVKGKIFAVGLWQIRAEMGPLVRDALLPPELNAAAAYQQWRRSGFSSWPSYRDKRYLRRAKDLP